MRGDVMAKPDGDFLDRLDAAIGCQLCGGSLGDSPSDDFCSPVHQRQWHEEHAEPLPWSEDAAMVYVGLDGARVPLNEPGAFSVGPALMAMINAPARVPAPRPRHRDGLEMMWSAVDEIHTHVPCNVGGCSNLARVGWTRQDSLCSEHSAPPTPVEWRLPRQTGNFTADLRACAVARRTAATDEQRAAAALRADQLVERAREPWRQLRAGLEPVFRNIAAAFEVYSQNLTAAYSGTLRGGRVTWTRSLNGPDRVQHHLAGTALDVNWPSGHECEPSARERALQSRRNRNTGPPAARMDGRRGRGPTR